MATSSITHNFVISNPNSVKHFIAADEEHTIRFAFSGLSVLHP